MAEAESKKARGERTGPLPTPNPASKRRYEATPSSIVPRPLAPHTEAVPEADDGRLAPKTKGAAATQPMPLHARPPTEKERSVSRYPPLAQASSAPITPGTVLTEDPARGMRPQAAMSSRMPGPPLGYFTEDRREIPAVLPHATPRSQETASLAARPTQVSAAEMPRMESLPAHGYRPADVHGSPLLAGQPLVQSSQQPYMQSTLMPSASHSRQTSLSKPPGSPAPVLQRSEADVSPIRRDSVSQRPFYAYPGQHPAMAQPPPVLSPAKEVPRPSSTPLEQPEAPRQVLAKRSNIMSILNDEPEEPQPRKRFASDQASVSGGGAASPSRPVYAGAPSYPQQQPPARLEEQKPPLYSQSSSYAPSRGYSEYPSYAPMSAGSAPTGNDWMARFDPRGQQPTSQQGPPPQPSARPPASMAPQPPFSPFTSAQSLSGPSLSTLTAPSPAPTPSPAPSQRPYAGSVYTASPAPHPASVSRELPPQSAMYRPSIGSPTMRNTGISYASRAGPPTPIQSPSSLLGVGPRQASATTYGSPVPAHVQGPPTPVGHQSYQQHVQTMVSGAHQPPAHRTPLGFSGGAYGRSTPPPPPPSQTSRGPVLAGGPPPGMTMARPYSPPTILQPSPAAGLSYAAGGPPPPVGAVHPYQTRPGTLAEVVHTPGHHRGYSQGSNVGLPGSGTPQHPPR